ncbi:MAG: prephenate dehydrogenase/arogenate dehydrogenase family protein [Fibrobacter sp.]|nr:prephenate dehydrogenase/arogenate dehydrogenase family protein [Fibrobacter sp.]
MIVSLVGFGLLAGSIASAIRQSAKNIKIHAISSPQNAPLAVKKGLADRSFSYDEIEQWLPISDLVLLCGPASNIVENIESIKKHVHLVQRDLVISDIGSTKLEICQLGATLPAPLLFVGGHPMAGSEKRGFEHSDPFIFENAYWILCPERNIQPEAYQKLVDVINITGAHQVTLAAQEHDRIMARLSHAPQLISTALAASIPPWIVENDYQHLAGRGFRDMTRIAASPWQMWKDIIQTNTTEITHSLNEIKTVIDDIICSMENSKLKDAKLADFFKQGSDIRASLSSTGKGFAQSLHEVMVHIPDQPGALLGVIEPLVQHGLNVLDIELAKVREGVGGTLLLGFKNLEDAHLCVKILEVKDLKAKVRI